MTLVKKTFLLFLAAFMAQLALLALLMGFGYRQAQNQWLSVRQNQAEAAARALLAQGASMGDALDYPGQIAVFDASGQVVATNRGMAGRFGMARNLMQTERFAVMDGAVVLGYYSTGSEEFNQDLANQALMGSLVVVAAVGLVVSLCVSLLAALYFSRLVSSPADSISKELQRMTDGDMDKPVDAHGSQELVRIATSIETLRKRLAQERTLRTQWSQDLAHDLRTPVSSIKAQLEGLSDGIFQPSQERFEKGLRELHRMEMLINDLEELMRLESPETVVVPQTIETRSFFQHAIERFERIALEKHLSFDLSVETAAFEADEHLFARAFSNVLSNAVSHAEDGSTVKVGAAKHDGRSIVWVNNRGSVIPTDELPKVFDRLYRGEFARTRAGSGLGLTIAQRIARLHGGAIAIESNPEAGTTVTFSLS